MGYGTGVRIYGQASNGEDKVFLADRVTSAMGVINTDHAYIHEGIAFKAHLEVGTLAHSTSVSYSFKTPAAKYLHLKNVAVEGTGSTLKLSLIRGTVAAPLVIDSAGVTATELTGPHNVNDVSAVVSTVVIKKTPTYVTGQAGAVWDFVKVINSATNQSRTSNTASMGDNFEWVLKPNTTYVLTLANLGGTASATDSGVELFWYEEDGT